MADAEKGVKEMKKEIKGIEKQIKDNKKKKILSQDEVWELEDRLAVLKEKMAANDSMLSSSRMTSIR